MTRRPKVWEPREGTSEGEEMPEWTVRWGFLKRDDGDEGWLNYRVRAPHAWDAWLQVKGAPAFGSCRVRRVEPLMQRIPGAPDWAQ